MMSNNMRTGTSLILALLAVCAIIALVGVIGIRKENSNGNNCLGNLAEDRE